MAQSYLIFDFGANEEGAQRARHRIEAWKQAFRLGEKMRLKFERSKPDEEQPNEKPKGKGKSEEPSAAAPERIRLFVRLDFSDHEKLSHQRWLERIPTEEPFKDASPQIVRPGETSYSATEELFDKLR